MLKKVVVFDNGYGGELFADYIEEEVPIVEVIRVIDWLGSANFYKSSYQARSEALSSLRPYVGRVDLIVVANHLVSETSLKFLQRKYPNQKFSGFTMEKPRTSKAERALILTTKASRSTLEYHAIRRRLKLKTREFECDHWAKLIDEGKITKEVIKEDLAKFADFKPQLIIIGCAQLVEIKPILRKIYGPTVSISDGYKTALKTVCKELGFRGGLGSK